MRKHLNRVLGALEVFAKRLTHRVSSAKLVDAKAKPWHDGRS
jgi:hypothetical protein